MFKSLCRNCGTSPYTRWGDWIGCCISRNPCQYNYTPSDNLEYLEWCLNKKEKLNV
jgi:hypothetical protein